jgi:predicted RNase H-like HicB family nuclease
MSAQMTESPTRGYAVELNEEDDGSWTAIVPDLPGAVAAGAEWADAVAQVGDAIDAWVAAAEASGAGVPPPPPSAGQFSGRFVVRVPRSLHRAASQRAARESVSLNTYCVAAIAQAVAQGLGGEVATEDRARGRAGRVVA